MGGGAGRLGGEVPAAERAGGSVLGVLAQADVVVRAVEAALGQGAHVLLREIPLRVAGPRQTLLAFAGGGGEALRVWRCVQPTGNMNERRT